MASQFKLCSFKTCPWVQRAAIVLRAKNVPYDITYIDRDNRPDWFLAVSPHSKVPVLLIDGKDALFESNAIAEYLDETAAPRLHPEDPLARARNRAWTDYVTTFASRDLDHRVLGLRGRVCDARRENRRPVLEARTTRSRSAATPARISTARSFRSSMPRTRRSCSATLSWTACKPLGIIEKFPHLAAWRDALLAAPAVKASTVPNIEAVWQEGLITRKRWLKKYVSESVMGADAVA